MTDQLQHQQHTNNNSVTIPATVTCPLCGDKFTALVGLALDVVKPAQPDEQATPTGSATPEV